jgi:hypothetical protein
MPLDNATFVALFGNAAKPYAQYEQRFGGRQQLYALYQSLGQLRFSKLIQGFYPDQLIRSLSIGLTNPELQQVGDMTQATLGSVPKVMMNYNGE